MKSFIFILIVAFSCVSCKQQNPNGTMTESEWKEIIPQATIMTDVMFNPTLELSEKIKETSLEELIIHRFDCIMYNAIKNRTDIDELYPTSNSIDGTANAVGLKAISSTSNLAKIYFLQVQDFYSFYKHNSSYYQSIIVSVQNKRKKQEKKRYKITGIDTNNYGISTNIRTTKDRLAIDIDIRQTKELMLSYRHRSNP